MDVRVKEKLKTVLLLGLVLTSILQAGIHWNRQAQGRPFLFITSIFSAAPSLAINEETLSVHKVSYITPDRIIVSDEQSARWELSTANPLWHRAWEDLHQFYLPAIFSQKPDKQLPLSSWNDILLSSRMALFEFETAVPSELLAWIVDARKTDGLPSGLTDIKKVAIVPSENVNTNMNTLYVLSSAAVFRYTLAVNSEALPKGFYVMKMDSLKDGQNRLFSLMGETYKLENASPDLLVSNEENDPVLLPVYEAVLPELIPAEFAVDNLQPVQESLLLSRKDSLLTRLGEGGNVTFSNTENIYRLNKTGYLTYRYLPSIDMEETDITSAFQQTLSFIEERYWLVGDAQLVLSSYIVLTNKDTTPNILRPLIPADPKNSGLANENRDKNTAGGKEKAFVFTFSYRVDGHTIMAQDGRSGDIVSPLQITATNTRVVSCDWYLRQFVPVSQTAYDQFFVNLDRDMAHVLPALLKKDQILSRLRNVYALPTGAVNVAIEPQWLLTSNNLLYLLPMKKGGE